MLLLLPPPLLPITPSALVSSLLQLKWFLYPIHMGTFKFKTRTLEAEEEAAAALLRCASVGSFRAAFSALRERVSDVLGADPPRRTCQTGLLRPRWTPARLGLLGHFLDLDSPAELLREHGALLTFRDPCWPPGNILGRVKAFPADLLREKGQILIFNSADVDPFPVFFSFFFSLSRSSWLPGTFFFSLFLKMLHRLDEVNEEPESAELGVNLGPSLGSGSEGGGSRSDFWLGSVDWDGEWLDTRWRGRRTPSTKSSSAERRLGWGKEGFRTIQNSNSGEVGKLPLLLAPVGGERGWDWGFSKGISMEEENEEVGRRGEGDEGSLIRLEWVSELWVQGNDPTNSNKEIRIKKRERERRSWVLDEDEACSPLPFYVFSSYLPNFSPFFFIFLYILN